IAQLPDIGRGDVETVVVDVPIRFGGIWGKRLKRITIPARMQIKLKRAHSMVNQLIEQLFCLLPSHGYPAQPDAWQVLDVPVTVCAVGVVNEPLLDLIVVQTLS